MADRDHGDGSDPEAELAALRERVSELEARCAMLAESDRLHRLIAEHFPNGAVHLLDRDLRYIVSSGRILGEIGISGARNVGHTVFEVMPPDSDAEILANYRRAQAGENVEFDCWFAGRYFHIILYPILDGEGKVDLILAMSQDRTDWRRAEENYQRSLALLSQAAALARVGAWEINLQTGEIDGSPEILNLIGVDPTNDRPPLSYYVERIHPDDRAGFRARLKAAISGKAPDTGEQRFCHPDGSLRYHKSISQFRYDEDGTPRYLTGTTIDVTEQVMAELARRQAEEELAQQRLLQIRVDRLRSLGEMSAGIAHELNQPLVGIRGLTEHLQLALARGWQQDAETVNRKLELILEQSDRMTHIIRHVRRFAGEAASGDRYPIDVDAVVHNSLELMQAHLHAHGVTVELQLAGDLPPVLANQYSLEEVFINLIINARDAIEDALARDGRSDGGVLTIRTTSLSGEGRAMVEIAFGDNGIGIEPDVQERLFEPFHTTKAPDRGTGLGLPISLTIVKGLGGTIEIESVPPSGTTAKVLLPAMERRRK